MRLWHKVSLAACLALLAFADLPAAKRKVTEAEVQSVHRSALLIDTHNDVTSFTVEGFDIGTTGSKHHTDLARLKTGGLEPCSLLPMLDLSIPQAEPQLFGPCK